MNKANEKKRTYKFRIRLYGLSTVVMTEWLTLALQGIEHEEDVVRNKTLDRVDRYGFPVVETYRDRMSKVLTKRVTDSEFKAFIGEFRVVPGFKLQKHRETGLILLNFDLTKAGS